MRFSRFAVSIAITAAALVSACAGGPTAPSSSAAASSAASSTTSLSFSSTPGDWVGQGQSARYTPTDTVWIARYNDPPHGHNIEVFPHSSADFRLVLAAPPGQVLTAGTYENARRFSDFGHPGIDFSAFRRACNNATGRFVIHALVVGRGQTIDRLHATFEQRCTDGWGDGSLQGEISIVPAPVR